MPADYGIGGIADAPGQVRLLVDLAVELELEERRRRLHGAVLHESMHVVQGFTMSAFRDAAWPTALEHAVYEGCATVFERERAGTDPPWGRYADEGEEAMRVLTHEVGALGRRFDLRRWKFWDDEQQRPWTLYRVGTYVVDRALAATGAVVEELAERHVAEVAEAAGFA